jgi:hypothetical protein
MTPECRIRFPEIGEYNVCFGPTKAVEPEPEPVFFSHSEWKLLENILKAHRPTEVWGRVMRVMFQAREVGIVHVR